MKFLALIFYILANGVFAKDLSGEYLKEKESISILKILELRKHNVLIIPGVLSESFNSKSNNQIKLNLLFQDGFKDQMALLKRLGVDHQFLTLESENTPAQNAEVIQKAIHQSKKPVLIYSHSKGGVDTLEAIRQEPGILSKIKGWVSIQTPFWGSPIASEFNNNEFFHQTGTEIFKWMGGDEDGLPSLSQEVRLNYMMNKDTVSLLSQIKQKIKFINYGSYKKDTFGVDTPLEIFRNITELQSGLNDGVVPLSSALMIEHGIDVDYIIEPEVDHLMTMTKYYLGSDQFNRKKHTLSVLKLLL